MLEKTSSHSQFVNTIDDKLILILCDLYAKSAAKTLVKLLSENDEFEKLISLMFAVKKKGSWKSNEASRKEKLSEMLDWLMSWGQCVKIPIKLPKLRYELTKPTDRMLCPVEFCGQQAS